MSKILLNTYLNFFLITVIIARKKNSVTENALMDAEQSVLDTFDFLSSENVDMDDDDENLRYIFIAEIPFTYS